MWSIWLPVSNSQHLYCLISLQMNCNCHTQFHWNQALWYEFGYINIRMVALNTVWYMYFTHNCPWKVILCRVMSRYTIYPSLIERYYSYVNRDHQYIYHSFVHPKMGTKISKPLTIREIKSVWRRPASKKHKVCATCWHIREVRAVQGGQHLASCANSFALVHNNRPLTSKQSTYKRYEIHVMCICKLCWCMDSDIPSKILLLRASALNPANTTLHNTDTQWETFVSVQHMYTYMVQL